MRELRYRLLIGLVAVIALAVASVTAPAQAQTFTATSTSTDGTDKASAVFSVVSGCGGIECLQIVLTNTSTFSSYHAASVLDGIFFDIPGATSATLSPYSAITPNALKDASACTGSCSPGPVNVGMEWGENYSASGFSSTHLTTTSNFGIGASAFSSLSHWSGWSNFKGAGTPPTLGSNLGGVDFGVVSSAFTSGSGTAGTSPLISSTVTFDLGVPTGTTLASLNVNGVTFAYGISPDGSAHGQKVPEPASVALLASGLAVLAFVRRRNFVGREPLPIGV